MSGTGRGEVMRDKREVMEERRSKAEVGLVVIVIIVAKHK